METVKAVSGVCEERVLTNVLCYMFNTICGLFDTISAYRTPGTPALLVVVHLLWVLNCAGRITLVCFAASSVVEQVRGTDDGPTVSSGCRDLEGGGVLILPEKTLKRVKYIPENKRDKAM